MTETQKRIIDTLSRSKRVLITTHVRPDGDALGTAAAMVLALRKVGVAAEVLLLSHLPRKYAFIFSEHQVPFTNVESGWPGEGSGFGVQGSGKPKDGPVLLNPEPRT